MDGSTPSNMECYLLQFYEAEINSENTRKVMIAKAITNEQDEAPRDELFLIIEFI